jgi:hypothetical protein
MSHRLQAMFNFLRNCQRIYFLLKQKLHSGAFLPIKDKELG